MDGFDVMLVCGTGVFRCGIDALSVTYILNLLDSLQGMVPV